MARVKSQVSIRVDTDFFKNLFEPARVNVEKKLGVRVSQINFTRMLFKNRTNLTPKLNFNLKDDIKLRNLKVRKKNGFKATIKKKK